MLDVEDQQNSFSVYQIYYVRSGLVPDFFHCYTEPVGDDVHGVPFLISEQFPVIGRRAVGLPQPFSNISESIISAPAFHFLPHFRFG